MTAWSQSKSILQSHFQTCSWLEGVHQWASSAKISSNSSDINFLQALTSTLLIKTAAGACLLVCDWESYKYTILRSPQQVTKLSCLLKTYNKTIRSSILSTCRGRGAILANSEFVNWFVGNVMGRYPELYGSDARIHVCMSELGVPLTKEPGFHQVSNSGHGKVLTLHSSSSCKHSTLPTTCTHLMMCLDFRSWVAVIFTFWKEFNWEASIDLIDSVCTTDEAWWMFILELRWACLNPT